MSKHIALVNTPAFGHVNPTLPLVRELVRRGHRVTYVITEAFREAVASAGAEVMPVDTQFRPPAGTVEFTPEFVGWVIDARTDDAMKQLPLLLAGFADDRPDAVCYDMMTPLGPMLAAKLGVPAIQLMPSFASNEHYMMRDDLVPSVVLNDPAVTAAMDRMDQSAEAMGIHRPVDGLFGPVIEDLNIAFLPQKFQQAGDTFDDRFVFIGPSLEGRDDGGDWQPPEPGTRLLFISLGTGIANANLEFYKRCLEAFADTDWQVVMAIGQVVDRAQLGTIPANFDVRPSVPQPAVLRHATAFVTHSGMNSTMEALYYGVPMLCAPHQGEQVANARRVAELGLGRHLPKELTAQALREAVDTLADDPSIRKNLDDMVQVIAKAGGVSAGVDAIEGLLFGN
jgi:MGT family glycosyltransferase